MWLRSFQLWSTAGSGGWEFYRVCWTSKGLVPCTVSVQCTLIKFVNDFRYRHSPFQWKAENSSPTLQLCSKFYLRHAHALRDSLLTPDTTGGFAREELLAVSQPCFVFTPTSVGLERSENTCLMNPDFRTQVACQD